MQIDDVLSLVESEIQDVETELLRNLDSSVPMVNEVAAYVFESGGKRLRPVFLVLAAAMAGYRGPRCTVLSGVVEYIHTATLLHDDVIDGAKYRRGRPSANRVFGNDIVVLCGDFLYSRAFMNLVTDGDPNCQMILAKAAKNMSEGEVFQLVKTADVKIGMEDYLTIINSKTAVLFSACCEIGAILADRPEEERQNLALFGAELGLAFQMSDDILDYLGDPEQTGKKPGTDLNEGKLTLPVLLLRDMASADEWQRVEKAILDENVSEEELAFVIGLMERHDIRKASETVVDEYINRAKARLDGFADSEYKAALLTLADYMVKRDR